MSQHKRFLVDYTYGRPGGSVTRTRILTSNRNLTNLAQSETAVLAFLRKRHPGLEVTIISLEWLDE